MTTRGHGEKRSRKQEAAIAALLSEPTVERAAVKAHVSYRTLKAWLVDPSFLQAYREARRSVVEGAVARLQTTCLSAVVTLWQSLSCETPSVRVQAAKAILDQSFRGLEAFDLLARVETLERQLAERGQVVDVPPPFQRYGLVPAPGAHEPGTNGKGAVHDGPA
jgi:hypothetical protein